MIQVSPFFYSDEEAWKLFLLKHRHCWIPSTLAPQVEGISRSFVKKCDGLPLEISVIARTVKTNIYIYIYIYIYILYILF